VQAVKTIFRQHGRLGKASPDDTLLVRGGISKRVYFVLSGQVLLHATSQDGRQIGFEIVSSDHIFGFAAVACHGRSFLDATALTVCELLSVKLDTFETLLLDNPEATRELLYYMSEQLFRRTRQAEGLALDNLHKRLARWIIALAHKQHGELDSNNAVHLEFNQKLMAAMAGVSRETVNRQLRAWIRSGMLVIEGKVLRILKPQALAILADPLDDIPT
jgi:CRP-like cAMP-binding protein